MNWQSKPSYSAAEAVKIFDYSISFKYRNWIETDQGRNFNAYYCRQLMNLVISRVGDKDPNLDLIEVLTLGDIVAVIASMVSFPSLGFTKDTHEVVFYGIHNIVNMSTRENQYTARISDIIDKKPFVLN